MRRQQGRASQRRRWAVLAGWLAWLGAGLGLAHWGLGLAYWGLGLAHWGLGLAWLGDPGRAAVTPVEAAVAASVDAPTSMDLPPPFVLPNLQQRRRRALRATAGTVLRRRCWRAGQAAVPTSPFTSGRGRPCTC